MKRPAPRPLRSALEAVVEAAAPPGVLPRAQRLWAGVAGSIVAGESQPVSERDGVVNVHCSSAVWAQELELMASEIRARLNAALGGEQAVRELRFTVASTGADPPGSGPL